MFHRTERCVFQLTIRLWIVIVSNLSDGETAEINGLEKFVVMI